MKTFGKKGVVIIIIALIAYFIGNSGAYPGLSNTVIPWMSESMNIDLAGMSTWSGYTGWLCAPSMYVWARLGQKKGAKFALVGNLFGAALCFICLAFVRDMTTWIISRVILNTLVAGMSFAAPALIANWFPTKKGLALGWATMGVIVVDLVWTPNIGTPVLLFGFTPTFIAVGIIVALFASYVMVGIKETPEEAGTFPDNIEFAVKDALAEKIAYMKEHYKSDWSVARVLKNPQAWFIAVVSGLFWLTVSAPIITFYPRMALLGYETSFITPVFTISAVCSLAGSWAFGWLDTKTSPKFALVIYGVMGTLALLILTFLAPISPIGVVIGTIMAFSCVGGIPNLQASIITTIWGRWDYSAAAKVIQPVAAFILCCGPIIIGQCLALTGNYEFLYYVLIGLTIFGAVISCIINQTSLGRSQEEVEVIVYGDKAKSN